jgi:hypothetical protein
MSASSMVMMVMMIMLQVPRYPDVRASATALPTLPSPALPYPFFFSFSLLQFWKPNTLLYRHYGISLCLKSVPVSAGIMSSFPSAP